MEPKITGIIIDNSRTEGKWYVREVEEGDGVKSLFFRRDKNDFLGRLIDKFKGAESAQRYAAAHMKDLNFMNSVELASVYEAPGKLKAIEPEIKKLSSDRLNNLLTNAGRASIATKDFSVTRINLADKAGLKAKIDSLWKNYNPPRQPGRNPGFSKSEFARLLQTALSLKSGALVTNDLTLKEECLAFVDRLRAEGPSAWKNVESQREIKELVRHFQAPPTQFEQLLQGSKLLGKATEMKIALENIIAANRWFYPELQDGKDLGRLLGEAFQIYFEESCASQGLEEIRPIWNFQTTRNGKLVTEDDEPVLKSFIENLKGLQRIPDSDCEKAVNDVVQAIQKRLDRIETSQHQAAPR